ncbi:MAG: spore germination protein [Clostridia bacterium]|nr:spore germination protein [Clostridia bacterium]
MDFKNLFNSIFGYTPPVDYDFSLPEDGPVTEGTNAVLPNQEEKKVSVFPSLRVNMEYMKIKYNLLINSDVILREFTINARGKQYNAFLVYIDGMVNSEIMDKFILEPLMLRNKSNLYDGGQSKVISEAVANNITVRKVKKFDLSNYLMGCLMPQNAVKEVKDFDEVASGINSR